jgi:hypothetical protein
MAIVYESYPGNQISKDNFAVIEKAIGRLVDGLPEKVFTHRLVKTYKAKGAAIMVCQNHETREWLVWLVPNITTWESFTFNVVGLKALLTYKRIVAWFPDPVKNTETLFMCRGRLNWCLGTAHRRTHVRREEPNMFRTVLSIDQESITALEVMEWRHLSEVGKLSSLFWVLNRS